MIVPTRIYTWRSALFAEIDRLGAEPFMWGRNDCALFAAACVKAMTGFDPARGYRGYKTAAGALKIVRKAGFYSYADFAASLFPRMHISRARVGDLALIELPGIADGLGSAAGVVTGAEIAVLRPDGLGFLPRGKAVGALAVGWDGVK